MISELIREDLKDFFPYETAKLLSDISYIRLHANESPWSMIDDNLNRYPKAICKEAVAQYYQVRPEEILATRGSNEGIDLLLRLFCKAGCDEISVTVPTFGMYKILAQIQNVKINSIQLNEKEDFIFDAGSIINKIAEKTKILFICSPNNPTGNTISYEDVKKICRSCSRKSIVVIDEAYIEFSNSRSVTNLINECNNLVVIRTLSKAFGLAGIRVGFVIGNEELIKSLQMIQSPYPIPSPCVQAIERVMSNEKIVQMWVNTILIKNSRKYLIKKFNELSLFEKIYPSEANFILVKLKSASKLELFAADRGVLLRKIGIDDSYLRIGIGSNEENQYLISIFQDWDKENE